MVNNKSNMRTEAIFSDDMKHRFVLKKSWDNSKPTDSIIMIAPSSRAGEVSIDMTTMYVINNCFAQGFGSIDILNLYSKLDSDTLATCPENDDWLLKSCQKSDKVILAWGKGQTARAVDHRIEEVIKLLSPCKDKLYEIADQQGNRGLHPLASSARLHWTLLPYQPNNQTSEQKK